MPAINQQNLDVKKTVEATMNHAKGWLFAKYPSAVNPKTNIQIDVRYLGEFIPNSQMEAFSTPVSKKGLCFQDKPICLIMKRGNTEVYLRRDVFLDIKERKLTSYILSIHTPTNNYRIIETPDGDIRDHGNHLLVWAARNDKDFGRYISFISKDQQLINSSDKSQWALDKIMQQSRENIR